MAEAVKSHYSYVWFYSKDAGGFGYKRKQQNETLILRKFQLISTFKYKWILLHATFFFRENAVQP